LTKKGLLRLDQLLVDQGYFPSLDKAQRTILAGYVLVNDQTLFKPSQKIDPEASIQIKERPKFVSRGGEKLEGAFKTFPISVKGKCVVDLGSSTGGFTDCLLQYGAKKVFAVDVGYGLIDYKLRQNPNVICMEKKNARFLRQEDFDDPISFLTADLSFISLKKVLPAIASILQSGGEAILLVKPQFEAQREEVKKGGVVRDPKVHERVILEVTKEAEALGFSSKGCIPSPIKGPAGNQEFLLWLKQG